MIARTDDWLDGLMVKSIFINKIRDLKDFLVTLAREGMSCEKLALCIASGVVLGIFPFLGATTLLCTVAALGFRLNLPLIQLINYAVYPLQMLLLVPFYAAGSWLFGRRLPVDAGSQLLDSLQNDLWGSLLQLWDLTLYAMWVWLLVSPMIVLLVYIASKPAVGRILSAVQRAQSTRNLSKNPT